MNRYCFDFRGRRFRRRRFCRRVRPQDNGCTCNVRHVSFADRLGRGERRCCNPPVRRPEIRLNPDVRQLGLGGASCGPRPMSKYVFPIETTKWVLKVTPMP